MSGSDVAINDTSMTGSRQQQPPVSSSANDEKVQSVKKLIQNLKTQADQERLQREEVQRQLVEEKSRSEEQLREITSQQDALHSRSIEIDELEFKNESLNKKIEGLQEQVKGKRNAGGSLFTGLFNGKQTQLVEQLKSQIEEYEEFLQIKSEEAERVHEHLYELKRDLNRKIESITTELDAAVSAKHKLDEIILHHEAKLAEQRQKIDSLTTTSTILSRDLDGKTKELDHLTKKYSAEYLSLEQVVAAQRLLLDIKTPSFKKQTINYDALAEANKGDTTASGGGDKKPQFSFKEKEREVFKQFNQQREAMKKHILRVFHIIDEKHSMLDANQQATNRSDDNASGRSQSSLFSGYRDASAAIQSCLTEIFTCVDNVSSLAYQVRQQVNAKSIEAMELQEEQATQTTALNQSLSRLSEAIPHFFQELVKSFEAQRTFFEFSSSSSSPPSFPSPPPFTELEAAAAELLASLMRSLEVTEAEQQMKQVGKVTATKATLERQTSSESLRRAAAKMSAKLQLVFSAVEKICAFENGMIDKLLAQTEISTLDGNHSTAVTTVIHEGTSSSSTQIVAPLALKNLNLTLITSFGSVTSSIHQVKSSFTHFLDNANSIKDEFVNDTFRSIDLLRTVEEYLAKIGRTIEIHLAISHQSLIREMSSKLNFQNRQIDSLQSAVEGQNTEMRGLIEQTSMQSTNISTLTQTIQRVKEELTSILTTTSSESSSSLSILPNAIQEILAVIVSSMSGIKLPLKEEHVMDNEEGEEEDQQRKSKFIKEVQQSLAPAEKILLLASTTPASTTTNPEDVADKRLELVFEKSRDKIIALLYQVSTIFLPSQTLSFPPRPPSEQPAGEATERCSAKGERERFAHQISARTDPRSIESSVCWERQQTPGPAVRPTGLVVR